MLLLRLFMYIVYIICVVVVLFCIVVSRFLTQIYIYIYTIKILETIYDCYVATVRCASIMLQINIYIYGKRNAFI